MKTDVIVGHASRLSHCSNLPLQPKGMFRVARVNPLRAAVPTLWRARSDAPYLLCLALVFSTLNAQLFAQLVPDGATNTLSNFTNSFSGEVTVGTNSPFTLLVLSDNTLLTGPANVTIGRSSTSKSNEVRLISSSARWQMGGLFAFPTINLGSTGAFNRLVLSNGATMGAFSSYVGSHVSASNNLALVTGPGSTWHLGSLFLGAGSAGNQAIVSDGGLLNCASSVIGTFPGSSNNLVTVTGTGSMWTNQNNLTVGLYGTGNQLLVKDGGAVGSMRGFMGSDVEGSNNVVVITGTGSSWTNAWNFEIGAVSINNQMIVSNGGRTVSGNGLIGTATSANRNSVLVTDVGSHLLITTNLFVGSNSALNRLVVSNGAAVSAGIRSYIGFNPGANSNSVTVTDAGSSWSVSDSAFVGSNGVANRLVVSNGATVDARLGYVGYNSGANSNVILVTGPDSAWASQEILLGYMGSANQLIVSNGGKVSLETGFGSAYLGYFPSASNNAVLVTGNDSLWRFDGILEMGHSGRNNRVTVANGGAVSAGIVTHIGFGSSGNQVLVTGTNSTWNGTNLYVGYSSGGNSLVVSDGGTLATDESVIVGVFNSSTSNRMVVDNGALTVTNSTATGLLDVRRGTNVFNAGLMEVDRLVLTNRGTNFPSFSFGNSGSISIPSGSPASTYPSIINVAGLPGVTAKVTVTLSNLSHTFPSDLDIMLLNPAGQKVMLMSDTGGQDNTHAISNVKLTFDDTAGVFLPFSTTIAAGTYYPTDWLTGETMPNPAPPGPYSINLSSFNGSSPNGSWRLYINDDMNPDSGSLVGWGLRISTDENAPDRGIFQFNGGTLVTRGAVISNGLPFLVGASGTTPALWDVRLGPTNTFIDDDLQIGNDTSFNQVILTNGAFMTNSGYGYLGENAAGSSNSITLAGSGSRWSSDGVIVGGFGSGNLLVVSNGAALVTSSYSSIGHQFTSTNNEAVVSGPGASWTSGVGQLLVGNGGRNNRLVISDGGQVVSFGGTIGDAFPDSSNNLAMVTGAGSSWSNAFELNVGDVGAANWLIVSNNAVVSAATAIYLGVTSTSVGNRLTVDGGTLRTTNALLTGLLDIRRGTNVLNAGLVEVDILRMTNTPGFFEFNGGTLSVKSSDVDNNPHPPLRVGNGSRAATLFLAGFGLHVFHSGLIISSNAVVTGNGAIAIGPSGPFTVEPGGQLSPGISIGTISSTKPPLLQGATVMGISKNGTNVANDQLLLTGGTLTYGGALIVTNLGPGALAAGDTFPLFSAATGSYAGSFSAISLPTLSSGLTWTNKLLVDGSIQVVGATQPVIANVTLSGTNLVITGTNGTPNASYAVLTTTNLAIGASNWISVITNQFGSLGEFSFTNVFSSGEPQRYFRIRTP